MGEFFIEQQVETIPTNSVVKKLGAQPSVFQQDNTSSIALGVNGEICISKQTCHINISYFYMTDKSRSGL